MKEGKYVILAVEDDPKLAGALKEFFVANQYEVINAESGEAALEVFFHSNHEIDIILLDVMLPNMDGYEVLKTIREYSAVPIIMTTSKESESEQLEGLKNGADNYITKPYRLSVLKAHVEVLLNRIMGKDRFFRAGKLKVDALAQKVYLEEEELLLTPKEFALLIYFIKNEHVVLNRDGILDAVWGFDYEGDIRTIDTLVKQLRKKITDECPYIHSVYGVGYYFEVDENE